MGDKVRPALGGQDHGHVQVPLAGVLRTGTLLCDFPNDPKVTLRGRGTVA